MTHVPIRDRTVTNPSARRTERKALGLSPRQFKKLNKAENRRLAAEEARLASAFRSPLSPQQLADLGPVQPSGAADE